MIIFIIIKLYSIAPSPQKSLTFFEVLQKSSTAHTQKEIAFLKNIHEFRLKEEKVKRGEIVIQQFHITPPPLFSPLLMDRLFQSAQHFLNNINLSTPFPQTVFIIGGGPIGMISALLYYSLGYNVSVFDKRNSFERIQHIQIKNQLVSFLERKIFLSQKDDISFFELCRRENIMRDLSSILSVVSLSVLESLLFKFIDNIRTLSSLPTHLEYQRDHTFQSFQYQPDTHTFDVVFCFQGTFCKKQCNLLIGCDGAHSRVRKNAQEYYGLYNKELTLHLSFSGYYNYTCFHSHTYLVPYILWGTHSSYHLQKTRDYFWNRLPSIGFTPMDQVFLLAFYHHPSFVSYLQEDSIPFYNCPLLLFGDALSHGYVGSSFNHAILILSRLLPLMSKATTLLSHSKPALELYMQMRQTANHFLSSVLLKKSRKQQQPYTQKVLKKICVLRTHNTDLSSYLMCFA